jgi:hypothetical protein
MNQLDNIIVLNAIKNYRLVFRHHPINILYRYSANYRFIFRLA